MDIIKTIFRLSFFILGCVMLMLALLVLQVGYSSFIWFFSFSILFFLLGYKITFYVVNSIFNKIFGKFYNLSSHNNEWITFKNTSIFYNNEFKEIKINDKLYRYSQIVSLDLFANNKKIDVFELKKVNKIKSLEIKLGIKANKLTYKKIKYITSKDNLNSIKKQKKNAIIDYEKLSKILKIKNENKISINLHKSKKFC